VAATVASAHSMYQSDIMLDFVGNEVHAELQIPLARMGAAFGKLIGLQTLSQFSTVYRGLNFRQA
jgi:hypothetical protein